LQPALANTLRRLTEDGLDSFYRGPLAEQLARGMEQYGLPVTLSDLQQHRARRPLPLRLSISTANCGTSRRRPRGWFRWRSSASPTGWRWPTPTMR
jgi:gamma-glutamyltranspeptidase